jgi:hypothetical protein
LLNAFNAVVIVVAPKLVIEMPIGPATHKLVPLYNADLILFPVEKSVIAVDVLIFF